MKHRRQARVRLASMKVGSCLSLVGALMLIAVVGDRRGEDAVREVGVAHVARRAQAFPVGSEEEGQLIPAVYAWDPAVRFVYYRHASKWM